MFNDGRIAVELLEDPYLPIFYEAGCYLFLADEGTSSIEYAEKAVVLYRNMSEAVPSSEKHHTLLNLAERALARAHMLGDEHMGDAPHGFPTDDRTLTESGQGSGVTSTVQDISDGGLDKSMDGGRGAPEVTDEDMKGGPMSDSSMGSDATFGRLVEEHEGISSYTSNKIKVQ